MKSDIVIHKIEARDLPDLWSQAIYDILDIGKKFEIDRGSFAGQTRLEYDYFIGHIINPGYGSGTPEILPQIPLSIGIPNPVEFEYIYGGDGYSRSYIEYVMTPTLEENESYTYGERLSYYPIDYYIIGESIKNSKIILNDEDIWYNRKIIMQDEGRYYLNQIELVIHTYKNKGYRNNQMTLQISKPDDCLLQDPPCLRSIDTRIQNNKLHFYIYFRSWDLWSGLPANLAGIEALHQSMANEIGIEQGEFIVESKGLHLYGYAENLAKMRYLKEI